MTGDWRDWRPALWLAMLGIAVIIAVTPHYLGAVFLGAAIGAALRTRQRRRGGRGSRGSRGNRGSRPPRSG